MKKSPFFMDKSTISMAMFNSYVSLPEGIPFSVSRYGKVSFKVSVTRHLAPRELGGRDPTCDQKEFTVNGMGGLMFL